VTATFTYHAALQSLTAQVASNLFEVRGLSLQLAEARDSLRVARELAEIGVRKARAGIGADVDADSLIADRATAQANVVQLEAQLAVSRQTLLVLLGRAGAAPESLPVDGALGPPPDVPQTTPATLLVKRPDVMQAEARLRSAMGTLRLDSLALLPKINLQASTSISAIAGPAGYTTSLWSLAAAWPCRCSTVPACWARCAPSAPAPSRLPSPMKRRCRPALARRRTSWPPMPPTARGLAC
jgi:outer membrane protein TolC